MVKIFSGCMLNSGVDTVEMLLQEVCVEDYYISDSEITNAQYSAYLYEQGYINMLVNDFPVVGITQKQALAFTRWLSKKQNKNYTLPTHAQWAYAAHTHGNNILSNKKNICSEANVYHCSDNPSILPVKFLKPNSWGLYDMFGNTWEWVIGKNSQQEIAKGGAWNSVFQFIDLSKSYQPSAKKLNNIGFRIVATD
jgi:formylglycine-generating enzyme required for sulfatase activity